MLSLAGAKKFSFGFVKTITENWDSKAPSAETLLAYLETTAQVTVFPQIVFALD